MATKENACGVIEVHSPRPEPQSPTKKLGPGISRAEKHIVTLDKMLDELEERIWRTLSGICSDTTRM